MAKRGDDLAQALAVGQQSRESHKAGGAAREAGRSVATSSASTSAAGRRRRRRWRSIPSASDRGLKTGRPRAQQLHDRGCPVVSGSIRRGEPTWH
jgi:hypothetical protein